VPLCPSTLKNIIIFSVNIIMEKIPTIPFSKNADIDKLENFRKKQNEKKKEEKEKKVEKDNIPYYSYNCNFIF
jgi:surface antigen